MVAVFLAPLYLLLCAYLLKRAVRWLGVCHGFFQRRGVQTAIVVFYLFLAFSILLAFWMPESMLRRILKLISNYWLGILLYLLLTIGTADLVRLVCRKIPVLKDSRLFSRRGHAVVGALCFAVVAAFAVTGIISAGTIRTTDYAVTVEKEAGSRRTLNVVLIADLHLGYSIGSYHMKKMVQKINALQPDLVAVAGDIFDNEYEALDDPKRLAEILRGIRSTYGVYAVYGNHDIQEPILAGFTFGKKGEKKVSDPRMDAFMEQAGVRLLRDETVLIGDSFYLCGRADAERPGRGIGKRKTPQELLHGLDRKKPIFVLDHSPRELQALADAGADLDLCGHTHDGQMFPGNLTIRLLWENACGYLKKGQMHSIVTSGVGVFGPNLRVGAKSEICSIRVDFAGEQ